MSYSLSVIQSMRQKAQKISCISLYDSTFARLSSQAGVEVLLVGDSLGMTVLGQNHTAAVTLDQMVYHTRAVVAGAEGSFVIADMPFLSCSTIDRAVDGAMRLMGAGAHMVKIEGGESVAEAVKVLSSHGVPVCGHLGLQPQFVHKIGGFKAIRNSDQECERLLNQVELLLASGLDLLVLECVPRRIAKEITRLSTVPVIGIGSGGDVDGQVLVIYDLLGMNDRKPKLAKNFLENSGSIQWALKSYVDEVRTGTFPQAEHCYGEG